MRVRLYLLTINRYTGNRVKTAIEHETLNPVIFPYDNPDATGKTGTPVFSVLDLFKPVKLAKTLQALIDELPGALPVRSYFTTVFP